MIDSLGLEGMILLGHSMGALHASLYAALNPGRVSALIHVDIEPCPPDWNRKYLLGLYKNLPDSYAAPEDFIAEIAKNTPYARPEHLRHLAEKSLIRRDGRWYRTYDREILARFDNYDLRGNLPDIQCPAGTRPQRRWQGPSRPARWRKSPERPILPTLTTPIDSGRS